jgi:hypothetical protein
MFFAFGIEIGKLGYDIDERVIFNIIQFFLDSGQYSRMFPYILSGINISDIYNMKDLLSGVYHQ